MLARFLGKTGDCRSYFRFCTYNLIPFVSCHLCNLSIWCKSHMNDKERVVDAFPLSEARGPNNCERTHSNDI